MDLTPNYSLIVQIVTFAVLFVGLNCLLFQPFLRLLDERHSRTTGAIDQAEQMRRDAEAARMEYESSLRDVRAQLAQEADATRNRLQAETAARIASARDAEAAKLADLRARLARQVDEARRTLSTDAKSIAEEMLRRVTGQA